MLSALDNPKSVVWIPYTLTTTSNVLPWTLELSGSVSVTFINLTLSNNVVVSPPVSGESLGLPSNGWRVVPSPT